MEPPFHPFLPFKHAIHWVQASPFLGLDDALVKQIAMASLDDAMILAGGAEGRSDWRDQRQAPWGGGGGHIFDRWFFDGPQILGWHQDEFGSSAHDLQGFLSFDA